MQRGGQLDRFSDGQRALRLIGRGSHAIDQTVLPGALDCVIEPVARGHVGERESAGRRGLRGGDQCREDGIDRLVDELPLCGQRQVGQNGLAEIIERAVQIPAFERVQTARGLAGVGGSLTADNQLRFDRRAAVRIEGNGIDRIKDCRQRHVGNSREGVVRIRGDDLAVLHPCVELLALGRLCLCGDLFAGPDLNDILGSEVFGVGFLDKTLICIVGLQRHGAVGEFAVGSSVQINNVCGVVGRIVEQIENCSAVRDARCVQRDRGRSTGSLLCEQSRISCGKVGIGVKFDTGQILVVLDLNSQFLGIRVIACRECLRSLGVDCADIVPLQILLALRLKRAVIRAAVGQRAEFVRAVGNVGIVVDVDLGVVRNCVAVQIGAVPLERAGGCPAVIRVIDGLRQIFGVVHIVDLAGFTVGDNHDQVTGIAERHRLHEQHPLERICGIRAGNCDSVRIEREIQLRVERVRTGQRAAGDGAASDRNQIGQIRPGVAGNVSVAGHNVDPVKLFHDGSLCPVAIEAHERAMEAGGRVIGCSGTREVDVALDVRAVRIDGVDIGHETIRQLYVDHDFCRLAGTDDENVVFIVSGNSDLVLCQTERRQCVVVVAFLICYGLIEAELPRNVEFLAVLFEIPVRELVSQILDGVADLEVAVLGGVVADVGDRVGDVRLCTTENKLLGMVSIDQTSALLSRTEGVVVGNNRLRGGCQQSLCHVSQFLLAQILVLRFALQITQDGRSNTRDIRRRHGGTGHDLITVRRVVLCRQNAAADAGDLRLERQGRGGAPGAEGRRLPAGGVVNRGHLREECDLLFLCVKQLGCVLAGNGNSGKLRAVQRHVDDAGFVVINDCSSCAGSVRVVDLVNEGNAAALDDCDLAGNVDARIVGRFAIAGNQDKVIRLASQRIISVDRIAVADLCAVNFNRRRGVLRVVNRRNRQVAVIGGRGTDNAVVRIVGRDIAGRNAGDALAVCHGAFVARCDAADDARVVQRGEDAVQDFFLDAVIDEAVLCAEGHIDDVRTQCVGVFKGCEINVAGGASLRRVGGEDLQCKDLCAGRGASKFIAAVIRQDAAGCDAGDVRAVTADVVGRVVVLVIIIIGERNLCRQIFAAAKLFNRGLSLLLADGSLVQHTVIRCERLVARGDAGIDDRNDGALAVVFTANLGDVGHVVGRIHAGHDDRLVVIVGQIDLLDARRAGQLLKVAELDVCGHTVEQRGVLVLDVIADSLGLDRSLNAAVLRREGLRRGCDSALRSDAGALQRCGDSALALKNNDRADGIVVRVGRFTILQLEFVLLNGGAQLARIRSRRGQLDIVCRRGRSHRNHAKNHDERQQQTQHAASCFLAHESFSFLVVHLCLKSGDQPLSTTICCSHYNPEQPIFQYSSLTIQQFLPKMFFHKLPCGSFTEACALNRDLKRFFDETGTECPVWKQLEQDAGSYLIP